MEKIQTKDLLEYRFISALNMAPEGNIAVFCLSQADWDTNGYNSSLWCFNTDDLKMQNITGTEGVRSFCFLDRHTILYPQIREEKDKHYINSGGWVTVFHRRDLRETEAKELFRVPLNKATASRVKEDLFLISAVRDNARPDIESMPESERRAALAKLEEEKDFEVCDELPFVWDGKDFVNKKRQALFLYDLKNDSFCPLTEPFFETSHFTVSPDGKYIAFSGVSYDRILDRTHGIWLYDTENCSTRTLLTPGSYQIMGLEFLNDELVVAAFPWNGIGAFPNHNLYTLPLSGGKLNLQHVHSREDFGSKTCSDCRYGANQTFKVRNGTLYYITTFDTGSYVNCWKPGQKPVRLNDASIVPDGFALGTDSVYISGTSDGLQELFILENGRPVQQTEINVPALKNKQISSPKKLQFTNKEGILISGFVIEPAEYDPEKSYPGILEIHGGPRAAFTGGFFHEMQLLAARGYFVFFCNPRGSAGRGEDFANIWGIRGTIDYTDLMEWTDFVLQTYPQIDPDRLGVMGGSYGGYMTNWIITQTNRFHAAVSMRSIANKLADYGVSDCDVWAGPGIYGGTPWWNEEKLREQSPLTYALKVRTPTLFLHSFEDHRCTLNGAMQMYTALQIKGVPTRMCLFRHASHELSRSGRPRSRIRRLNEIIAWIDQFLAVG